MSIRILIADDDPNIRLLLRRLLEKQQDWHVCGEASNGIEAIVRSRAVRARYCGYGSRHACDERTAGRT